MDNWFCSVFNVVCRKRLSSPRCRSELIDSAWVVIVPGQKMHTYIYIYIYIYCQFWMWNSKCLGIPYPGNGGILKVKIKVIEM